MPQTNGLHMVQFKELEIWSSKVVNGRLNTLHSSGWMSHSHFIDYAFYCSAHTSSSEGCKSGDENTEIRREQTPRNSLSRFKQDLIATSELLAYK